MGLRRHALRGQPHTAPMGRDRSQLPHRQHLSRRAARGHGGAVLSGDERAVVASVDIALAHSQRLQPYIRRTGFGRQQPERVAESVREGSDAPLHAHARAEGAHHSQFDGRRAGAQLVALRQRGREHDSAEPRCGGRHVHREPRGREREVERQDG